MATKKKIEKAESSASNGALFKEDMPGPLRINTADVWMNQNKDVRNDKTGIEYAAEEDSLMGRLAKRMASRDHIDQLNLGTRTPQQVQKAREIADDEFPTKMHMSNALKTGIKIEHEHDDSIKKIVSGKAKPEDSPELIAKDHLREHKKYYDEKEGLPAMEKRLKKEPNSMAQQARAAGNVYGKAYNRVGEPY